MRNTMNKIFLYTIIFMMIFSVELFGGIYGIIHNPASKIYDRAGVGRKPIVLKDQLRPDQMVRIEGTTNIRGMEWVKVKLVMNQLGWIISSNIFQINNDELKMTLDQFQQYDIKGVRVYNVLYDNHSNNILSIKYVWQYLDEETTTRTVFYSKKEDGGLKEVHHTGYYTNILFRNKYLIVWNRGSGQVFDMKKIKKSRVNNKWVNQSKYRTTDSFDIYEMMGAWSSGEYRGIKIHDSYIDIREEGRKLIMRAYMREEEGKPFRVEQYEFKGGRFVKKRS